MSSPLIAQLHRARRELLDLTTRNRLLSTALHTTRTSRIDIVDESSAALFELLVHAGRTMQFRDVSYRTATPDSGTLAETAELTEPTETAEPRGATAAPEPPSSDGEQGNRAEPAPQAPLSDRYLQTDLESDVLQSRLLRLYYDARLCEEEQGSSNLYLALGFLEWHDSRTRDKPRYAPLLLIPVHIERRSARTGFRLLFRDDEVTTNLSLQAKLLADFGIQLPDVPELEDLSPVDYFAAVEQATLHCDGWSVHPDRCTLWFFSFSRFLMFRDLDPDSWPDQNQLEHHPLLAGLLQQGFPGDDAGPPEVPLDRALSAQQLIHVLDADSSQAEAVSAALTGRNLVIQGPPGTGKSQTITNLIAAAVHAGKRVLFVAEKMAALDVVKSRLDRIGLGDMCLELHSHKANKRSVLQELGRTLELGQPTRTHFLEHAAQLQSARDRLNQYVSELHAEDADLGTTPFRLIGRLTRLTFLRTAPLSAPPAAIEKWNDSDWNRIHPALEDIQRHTAILGNPDEHPWRGVARTEPLLPSDEHRLRDQLQALAAALEKLLLHIGQLEDELPHQPALSELDFLQAERELADCEQLLDRPAAVPNSLASDSSAESQRILQELATLSAEWQELRHQLRATVADLAWTTDLTQARLDLAAFGRSWYRWFVPAFHRARRQLAGVLKGSRPGSVDSQLELLDRIISGQKLHAKLTSAPVLTGQARATLGTLWRGADTDWDAVRRLIDWRMLCRRLAERSQQDFAGIINWQSSSRTPQLVRQTGDALRAVWEQLLALFLTVRFDPLRGFCVEGAEAVVLRTLNERLSDWRQHLGMLGGWITLQQKWSALDGMQLGDLEQVLREAGIPNDQMVASVELAYVESAIRRLLPTRPALAGFDAIQHDRLVREFQLLDQEHLQLVRTEVARAHHDRIPRGGEYGELGVLKAEIRKKRRHRPIRRLLTDAGRVIERVKPVFMMSPISVAQYLEPGAFAFDLLIMDEASQIRPVDALGAIARCSQLVVVGDHRQLPPTSFFDRMLQEDQEAREDDLLPADVESILDLCVARNMNQRMLRWHYRSRHHSLIAVSNREFYDNRLFVIPSPVRKSPDLGLRFHQINGLFDRGRSRTNSVEAAAVAEAVLRHARQSPDQSLGVGTFSVAQRDEVLDCVERLRLQHAELDAFLSEDSDEPFFVKNLENIQGDERDVIFISVGYGADASGKFSMAFGPLSNEGGERRLNVLITRSRARCEVFCSFRAAEIDLTRTTARGAAALKAFLQFAEQGADGTESPEGEATTEFERVLVQAVQQQQLKAVPRVGLAGCFVDVAVAGADDSSSFTLGIEYDGPDYAGAAWARDRDRLRQFVLERQGWAIQRLWITEWLRDPHGQLESLVKTLTELRDEAAVPDSSVAAMPVETVDTQIVRCSEPAGDGELASPPYREAEFAIPLARPSLDSLADEELQEHVRHVIEIEGPVHQDEIARRIARLAGLTRVGARVEALVGRALHDLVTQGVIGQHDSFCSLLTQTACPVRSRESVTSAGLRKPDMIPSSEIRAAIRQFVERHVSVTRDETITGTARSLGFRVTSASLRDRFEPQLDRLLDEGQLILREGRLSLAASR